MDNSESYLEALNLKIVSDNIVLICIINTCVVTGFFGNILSVVFFGFMERRNTNDALIALLTTSNAIANIIAATELVKYINYFTFYNEIGCKVHYFLSHSFTKISGVMLVFIALNRHRLLCYPFSWQLTPKILSVSLSAVVLYLVLSSAVQLRIAHIERIQITTNETNQENRTVLENLKRIKMTTEAIIPEVPLDTSLVKKTCINLECANITSVVNGSKLSHINQTSIHPKIMNAHVCTNMGKLSESNDIMLKIFNVSDLIVTITSFLLILYFYGSIAKVIFDHWKHHKIFQQSDISKQKNEKFRADIKITLMTVTFTVMSLLSFTPYYVARSLQNRDLVSSDQVRLRFISASYMINNAIDPYVLLAFMPGFRRFVKRLFCCDSRQTTVRGIIKDQVCNKESIDTNIVHFASSHNKQMD